MCMYNSITYGIIERAICTRTRTVLTVHVIAYYCLYFEIIGEYWF